MSGGMQTLRKIVRYVFQASSNDALNTGTLNSVTAAINVSKFFEFAVQVIQESGTITAAVCTVQVSADGTNWQNTSYTISAEGYVEGQTALEYIRVKVTTASTVASTAIVHVQAK